MPILVPILVRAFSFDRAPVRAAAACLLLGTFSCGAAPATAAPAGGPTASSASGGKPAAPAIRRTLLGRQPAHERGWETRLYLIEYPPGAEAPLHVHPAMGVGWVLDGELESAFGDEPIVKVRAGAAFVDQADVPHRLFRNASPDRALRFVIAYTLRAGDEPLRLLP
jgi:quercetin dioxygenase-like cupin family protein